MQDIKHTTCSVASCDRSAHYTAGGRGGLCSTHYKRKLKNGDENIVGRRSSPALDWLRAHVSHPGDDCLIWPFHIAKDGYGRVHEPETNKLMTASRLMCSFAHGQPDSADMQAAHSCGKGNIGCVNPRHLYWTDHTGNQADRVAHGTTNRGERQGQSKLTEDDVRQIRSLKGLEPQSVTAARFDVNQSTISDIRRRKRWAWLD